MDTLIERYQLRAVRAAYLIVGERPLAEDIVQDAFVQLVPIFQRFDESRPFAPWFFGCVPHDALKAVQRQKRLVSLDEAESVEAVELLTALSDSQPGPEALALQAETRWEVWRGSGMSDPRAQCAVIVQRSYPGYSEHPAGTIKWLPHPEPIGRRWCAG